MDFKSLQRKAKQLIDKRGGTESLKAEAEELKDIARGPGSVTDKAKRAGDALKEPGAKAPSRPRVRACPPLTRPGPPLSPLPIRAGRRRPETPEPGPPPGA